MNRMMMIERGVRLLTLALAVLYLIPSVPILFGGGDFDSEAVRVVYGAGGVSAGVAILAGLLISSRTPWLSAGLVAGGAIAMAVLWFWFFYALVPLTLLVVAFAIARARRAMRKRDLAIPA